MPNIAKTCAESIIRAFQLDKDAGKEKLSTLIEATRRPGKTWALAVSIRQWFNKLWSFFMAPENYSIAASVVSDLQSDNALIRKRALDETARLAQVGSWVYDDIVGLCVEMDEQNPGMVGFGVSSITNAVKKAASNATNVKKAVSTVKQAAKVVKKHDFTKDIHIANQVGKAVGPIAAMAPPPYGPAIAAGLTVLNVADKYNQGTLSPEDAAAAAEAMQELGVQDAMADAGIEESQAFTYIMQAAKTAKNAGKAQDLIAAVNSGDKTAIEKIKAITEGAKSGNSVAMAALDAVKTARKGEKLPVEVQKKLIKSIRPNSPLLKAASKARTIYTSTGEPVRVISPSTSGVAREIQIATNRKR